MSRGVTSQPCIWCNSSDALTYYDDGAYCFSCHRKQLDKTISLVESNKISTTISNTNYTFIKQALPIEAKAWLYSYHFTDEQIEDIGAWYDPSYNRVFIPTNKDDLTAGLEARALDGSKPKWLSFGKKTAVSNHLGPPYHKIIIVEDLLSYIRLINLGYHVICLRGTHLKREDYIRLNNVITRDSTSIDLCLWLDGDRPGQNAVKKILTKYYWCATIRWLNIKTPHDPKAYSDSEIKGYVDVALPVNQVFHK